MAGINDEGFLELSGVNRVVVQEEELSAEKFPILEGMSPLSLRVLNLASRVIHVAKNVQMVVAGDAPQDMYFIAKGSILVTKEHLGKLQVVAKLKAGDFYGEYGVLSGKTRYASVYTAEPSVIIRIDLNAIHQVLDTDETFKKRLYQAMKERMLNSFLFSHVVFQKVSSPARDILAKNLSVTELNRDDTLFKEGDRATLYYIILTGEVEILLGKEKETLLEIRRNNDSLGEVRSNKGAEYAYTARASNHVDLLILDKNAMQQFQQADAEIIPRLNQLMAKQVKKTHLAIQELQKA